MKAVVGHSRIQEQHFVLRTCSSVLMGSMISSHTIRKSTIKSVLDSVGFVRVVCQEKEEKVDLGTIVALREYSLAMEMMAGPWRAAACRSSYEGARTPEDHVSQLPQLPIALQVSYTWLLPCQQQICRRCFQNSGQYWKRTCPPLDNCVLVADWLT